MTLPSIVINPRSGFRVEEIDEFHSLGVWADGAGPPTILIHGALTTHSDWPSPLLDALSRESRVLAVDRPGHGASRRPRFSASPDAQAWQIRQGLAAELTEPAIVVGHSFGAQVALAFASQFPDLTAGVVLLSPLCLPEIRLVEHFYLAPKGLPFFGPSIAGFMRAGPDRVFLEAVHYLMFDPQLPPAIWKDTYPYEDVLALCSLIAEGEDAMSSLSVRDYGRLLSLHSPVCMVLGAGDLIVRHERQGLFMAQFFPDCRVCWAERSGHMVHHTATPRVSHEILALHEAVTRSPAHQWSAKDGDATPNPHERNLVRRLTF